MTTKTLVRRASALSSLSDGLETRNGQLVPTPALLEGLRLAESLQRDLDAFYGSIKTFLEIHGLDGAEGEWGYIKLSPQRRLYATGDVKPRFLTSTVNTKVVRAYQELHNGQLPAGIAEKTTNRLTKKVKD